MIQMNLIIKHKKTHRFENELMAAGGEDTVREFGKVIYTLLYLKW